MDTIRFDEAIEELEKEIVKVKSINEMYAQINQIRESVEKDFLPKISSIESQINVKEQNLNETIKMKSNQLLEQADNNIAMVKLTLDNLQKEVLVEQEKLTKAINDEIETLRNRLIELNQLATEIKSEITLLEKHLSNQDEMIKDNKECIFSLQKMMEDKFKSNKTLHIVSIVAVLMAIVCVIFV